MTKSKEKIQQEKPSWLKLDEKGLEDIIAKLAGEGKTSEKIGLELRDTYGVPKSKVLGKKISAILKEKGLYKDATELNLEKKRQAVISHLQKNKQDKRAKMALAIISARITKYNKYKKRKNANEAPRNSKRISKRKRK